MGLFTRGGVEGDIRFEETDTGIRIMLHYAGGAFKLLPQDSDAELVHHSPQVMGGVEGVLDADQMPVVPDPPGPVFGLLAARNSRC